jgi:hypothetical protein
MILFQLFLNSILAKIIPCRISLAAIHNQLHPTSKFFCHFIQLKNHQIEARKSQCVCSPPQKNITDIGTSKKSTSLHDQCPDIATITITMAAHPTPPLQEHLRDQ